MPPSVRPQVVPSERRLRIEVLRMRAEYERLSLTQSACALVGELRPQALADRFRDRLGAAGLGWMGGSLQLLRRSPLLMSLLTALVSDPGRRRIVLKSVLIAGLVWLGKRARRA
jgi:hypothetical protein